MIECNTEQRKIVKSLVNALRKDMILLLSNERKLKLPKKYRIMMNKDIREIKKEVNRALNDFLDKNGNNN